MATEKPQDQFHYTGIWWELVHTNGVSTSAVSKCLHENNTIDILHHQKNFTPLYCALKNRNSAAVQVLLDYGANPNTPCHSHTPLYIACYLGDIPSIEALLKAGADLNTPSTSQKLTPLHALCARGLVECVRLFFSHPKKCDPNPYSPKAATPLHVACRKNCLHIAEILLKNGARVSDVDEMGETPIHAVCKTWNVDKTLLVRLLKHIGPSFPWKDKEGFTPLHHLVAIKAEEPSLFLLDRFPSIALIRTNRGLTPLQMASSHSLYQSLSTRIHLSTISMGFPYLLMNSKYSDLNIILDRKVIIPGHKILIEYRWPKIAHKIFKNELSLSHLDLHIIYPVLHYAYTNEVPNHTYEEIGKAIPMDSFKNQIIEAGQYVGLDGNFQKIILERSAAELSPTQWANDLNKAFLQAKHHDITFVVEGVTLSCSKAIISKSEYFKKMFSGPFQEAKSEKIKIQDLSYKAFRSIIQFLYSEEIEANLSGDELVEVLQRSVEWMIKPLTQKTENELAVAIDIENCCTLYLLATLHNCVFLQSECFQFIIRNWDAAKKSEDFELISQKDRELMEENVGK